ncbi:hypothetical protein HUU62_08585 [Rhodoferax sp. 4810]|uniref:Uncharacterized protein n=1 Tax=Thiospirillum jenense TaxID=1653858 RepID=A0A839H9M9_9GAMM|nr:hypothetical protein [Thiospirillum jenense]MBB1074465.1 hypothetical protein [Rhodoferax jenense]MBB1125554.1 hypothetical protein [Thiospirillum jenense]
MNKQDDLSADWKAVINRHSNDIDKAHERVRNVASEMEICKTRLSGIDTRIATVEARIHEQREILASVNEHVMVLKSTQDALMMTVLQASDITTTTNKLIQEHVNDESIAFSKQTKRLESVSRYLILVFSSIASLVVVLGAIHQHMTGSNLFASLGGFFVGLIGSN